MTPITLPLLNPNEPDALLATLHVQEGQHVQTGDALCTLETTKSTLEMVAPGEGYIRGLQAVQGDMVTAGDVLCWLVEKVDEKIPEVKINADAREDNVPGGMRITQPARALAAQHGLDLHTLPQEGLITEKIIRAHLSQGSPTAAAPFDAAAILVYGGGGHGKAVIDFIRALRIYTIAGVMDDGMPAGTEVLGVPVLGGEERLDELRSQGVRLAANAVGGIGNITQRIAVFDRLARGDFVCPALVHPRAYVEPSARMSAGVHVFPLAYVGSQVEIGYGCLANTGCIISHDCVLAEYVNLSPGVILAGNVHIGRGSLLGMGVNVNLGVRIGSGVRIGNGAIIKGDVKDGYVVRAGAVFP
jgi:acetyltransferase EpsM